MNFIVFFLEDLCKLVVIYFLNIGKSLSSEPGGFHYRIVISNGFNFSNRYENQVFFFLSFF